MVVDWIELGPTLAKMAGGALLAGLALYRKWLALHTKTAENERKLDAVHERLDQMVKAQEGHAELKTKVSRHGRDLRDTMRAVAALNEKVGIINDRFHRGGTPVHGMDQLSGEVIAEIVDAVSRKTVDMKNPQGGKGE